MVGELDKSEFKPTKNYNEFYAGHKFEPFPETLALNADQVLPRVAWAIDVAKEIGAEKVLDLCCLDGFAALSLANHDINIEAVGVDLSKPGIVLANERARKNSLNATFYESAIEGFAYTSRFDLILLFEAIEHFKDVDIVMAMIKRHMKPGATLLVSTPDAEGSFGIANTEDICHLQIYSHRTDDVLPDFTDEGKPIISLPGYLESQGFTVVEDNVYNELVHVRATY